MIIVDTNVISEPMKPVPEERVLRWINEQQLESLFFTSISLAELLTGIERLPDGRRKRGLLEIEEDLRVRIFGERILPFDAAAARTLAPIYNAAASRGARIEFPDCQIAAIAALHGFAVATRDEAPFRAAGCTVINPWTA